MSENLENLTPGLAIRLKALSARESPEIEKMSEAEFAEYWKRADHHISPKVAKAFKSVLEDAEARLRLQDARKNTPANRRVPLGWILSSVPLMQCHSTRS